MNYQKNNLDKSASVYLQQHKENPVHWQEWHPDVLAYAKQQDKLILISMGYSTCHWCQTMAHDTFQDKDTADFLNEQFVCILIDRELRPDIDQYLMSFSVQTTGIGGWPLNVMLTPDLKPFASTTYVPAHSEDPKIPSFLMILVKVVDYYRKNKDDIKPFILAIPKLQNAAPQSIIPTIESQFDASFGGFGGAPKFPPHATLLFLLTVFAQENIKPIYIMLKKTLDAMAMGGLHDHLQGGFFRYCVDAHWTIPHFEKMLYDQAWLLWSYSAAYKALKEENYKKITDKLLQFLLTQFTSDGLLYTAIAADIDNREGALYLWTTKELQSILTPQEYTEFSRVYKISDIANAPDNMHHLIKNHEGHLDEIEQKLLEVRNKRTSPFIDTKHLTSWNAIAGVGLLMAYRCTNNAKALSKAKDIFSSLQTKLIKDGAVLHSIANGGVQKEGFLEDCASMLLFTTFMHEETGEYKDLMLQLMNTLLSFKKDGIWYESLTSDFMQIPANPYDYMLPTSSSIAEFALIRAQILQNQEIKPLPLRPSLQCDFLNISALLSNGLFHVIESPKKIEWAHLPLNTIQRRSSAIKHYFEGKTKEYASIDELLNALSTSV